MVAVATSDRSPPLPAVDISTALPVRAAVAFEAFSDVIHTPRWFRGVRDARLLARDPYGRTTSVQFTYDTPPLNCQYVLTYRYNANDFAVTWCTEPGSIISLKGEARFVPISSASSLMTYRLERVLPDVMEALDQTLTQEAAGIVDQFRGHLTRILS